MAEHFATHRLSSAVLEDIHRCWEVNPNQVFIPVTSQLLNHYTKESRLGIVMCNGRLN